MITTVSSSSAFNSAINAAFSAMVDFNQQWSPGAVAGTALSGLIKRQESALDYVREAEHRARVDQKLFKPSDEALASYGLSLIAENCGLGLTLPGGVSVANHRARVVVNDADTFLIKLRELSELTDAATLESLAALANHFSDLIKESLGRVTYDVLPLDEQNLYEDLAAQYQSLDLAGNAKVDVVLTTLLELRSQGTVVPRSLPNSLEKLVQNLPQIDYFLKIANLHILSDLAEAQSHGILQQHIIATQEILAKGAASLIHLDTVHSPTGVSVRESWRKAFQVMDYLVVSQNTNALVEKCCNHLNELLQQLEIYFRDIAPNGLLLAAGKNRDINKSPTIADCARFIIFNDHFESWKARIATILQQNALRS